MNNDINHECYVCGDPINLEDDQFCYKEFKKETAFVEEDVHGLSDTIWNKSGSSDGLDHLRYPGEIGG